MGPAVHGPVFPPTRLSAAPEGACVSGSFAFSDVKFSVLELARHAPVQAPGARVPRGFPASVTPAGQQEMKCLEGSVLLTESTARCPLSSG